MVLNNYVCVALKFVVVDDWFLEFVQCGTSVFAPYGFPKDGAAGERCQAGRGSACATGGSG